MLQINFRAYFLSDGFLTSPSVRMHRQHPTGLCYRQADFLGIHMTTEPFQLRGQRIGKHCRCKTCGVGISQGKITGSSLRISVQSRIESINGVLDLPDLSFGTSSIGGRIHDNAVVVIAATDLPLHKFHTVIHQPTDWCLLKAGRLRIFFCPVYHALGGIYMRHRCSCGRCCQRCSTGIGKKVQYSLPGVLHF